MNEEEVVVAVEAMESSKESNPSRSANTQAMFDTVVDLTSSSEGMDEAKEALNTSIAKMMSQDDPFMQMMIAIYEVIPGTLLYKEEKLIYDTDTFKFVTQLNNHMTKMMNYYSKSADYEIEANAGATNETGLSTGGSGEDVWGFAAGDAYMKEMQDLKALVVNSGLPEDIKQAMESAFVKIGVANSSSLWNGLAGPYRVSGNTASHHQCDITKSDGGCGYWKEVKVNHDRLLNGVHTLEWVCKVTGVQGCGVKTYDCANYYGGCKKYPDTEKFTDYCRGHTVTIPGEYGKYKVTVGDGDWVVKHDGKGMAESGYSLSSERTSIYQPAVDSSTSGNLELQTVINSYSATVEAEYMFDMEQYNTYANTNAQTMKAHIDQVAAPVTRLTHISHA